LSATTPTIDLSPFVWPLAIALVAIMFIRAAPEFWRVYRHRRAGLDEIDRMPGREFEHYLGLLFERIGYRVEVTKAHGDFGADLVVRRRGKRVVVQAKRWKGGVGVKAVQEAAAAVAYYRCDEAMVVANRSFTKAARQLAKANRVELWDRDQLAAKIIEARLGDPARQQAAQPQHAVAEPPLSGPQPVAEPTPTCSRCGSPMVLRSGPRGAFFGCSTFPRCRNTLPNP